MDQEQKVHVSKGPRATVADDGFALDRPHDTKTLYQRLGHKLIVQLSTAFYQRVYHGELGAASAAGIQSDQAAHAAFRALFRDVPESEAVQNQYEFFVQRWGGPPLYSKRKGGPMLRARHHKFRIDSSMARTWTNTMYLAMLDVKIPQQEHDMMVEFFDHVAHFLRNHPDADALEALKQARDKEAKERGTDVLEQLHRGHM